MTKNTEDVIFEKILRNYMESIIERLIALHAAEYHALITDRKSLPEYVDTSPSQLLSMNKSESN